eukprot:scaffold97115_cov66-Phaeocystis_antarctica.AAC.4
MPVDRRALRRTLRRHELDRQLVVIEPRETRKVDRIGRRIVVAVHASQHLRIASGRGARWALHSSAARAGECFRVASATGNGLVVAVHAAESAQHRDAPRSLGKLSGKVLVREPGDFEVEACIDR